MNLSNMLQLNRFETNYHPEMNGKEFVEDTLTTVREAFVGEDGYRVIRITHKPTGGKKLLTFGHTLESVHMESLGSWIGDRIGQTGQTVGFLVEMFISSTEPSNLL